jgi:SMODS and SLOG-associating 2TM effector domain 2
MPTTTLDLARVPEVESHWNPDKILESIEVVRRDAKTFANDAVDWYYSKKKSKAHASQICRAFSIVFISIGGLTPVLGSVTAISSKIPGVSEWGYVFLGLGASLIALDKFSGFSSGWTRYVLTAQVIQKIIYSFELDWTKLQARLGSRAPEQSEVEEFLQTAKTLYDSILGQVAQETQQWAAEFQQSISDLESMAKAKMQASEPGALAVSISGSEALDSEPEVIIDEVSYGRIEAGNWAISRIAPGNHAVRIVGSLGGKRVQASDVVTIPPGGKAQVSLALR